MSDRQSRVVMTAPANAGRRLKLAATPEPYAKPAVTPFETVGGRKGLHQEETTRPSSFTWRVERTAAPNYRALGQRLAAASGDLYRNGTDGHGLLLALPDGRVRLILKGADLAPVIVDRVKMRVIKEGKVVSELPAASHLAAMLRSEAFLSQFLPVDEVATHPFYLQDFSLVRSGYNDGGPGQRVLYLGPDPEISDSTATIESFLDVMDFATSADRTNAAGAALTMPLRRHWPGEKPLILVTATKSHAGKGTVTEFFRGGVPKADILYESQDWPMLSQFQRQLQANAEIGLVMFDNVRCDSAGGRGKFIRSGFLEGFVTTSDITLATPGGGEPVHRTNRYVVTINTNDGRLSADLMNRALPIHLSPVGNVEDRENPIGNPKLEFLPQNIDRIQAELHGMIQRWKVAGCPMDEKVKHSMTPWARTIGGILKLAGFQDFLANCSTRKTTDDSVREAIGILGAVRPGKELRPKEWAKLAVEYSLAKDLISANERDTEKGRERAIGVVFKKHIEETFEACTDTKLYRLRLTGGCRRWRSGKNPHVRYRFEVLSQAEIPADDGSSSSVNTPGP
ncbi:MAG: hypothetical protein ACYC3X_20670 [Pirellulaceae bacterium]